MRGGRSVRRIGRWVARMPPLSASFGLERGHHLGSVPPGEEVDGVGNDEWRRVAFSDVDLPLARQRIGRRCWLSERARRTVAVESTPLRIVLRRGVRGGRSDTRHQQRANDERPALH